MLEILLGFISGMISGMGMGGGTILIPGLVLFVGIEQKTAQGINLLYFMPSAIAALILHIKNKHIQKGFLVFLIGGGCWARAGSFSGCKVFKRSVAKNLRCLLVVMGIMRFSAGHEQRKIVKRLTYTLDIFYVRII